MCDEKVWCSSLARKGSVAPMLLAMARNAPVFTAIIEQFATDGHSSRAIRRNADQLPQELFWSLAVSYLYLSCSASKCGADIELLEATTKARRQGLLTGQFQNAAVQPHHARSVYHSAHNLS